MDSSNNSCQYDKQIIKEFIKKQIKQSKDLRRVKDNIITKYNIPLTDNDLAYIESKYIKYCAHYWLNDVKEYLDDLDADCNEFVETTHKQLFNVDRLDDIPGDFKDSSFLKLLRKHKKIIPRQLEITILIQFKEKCLVKIIIASANTAQEFRFFQALMHFIDTSRTPQKFIANLKLKDFCSGIISANTFLRYIKNLDVNIFGIDVTNVKRTADEFLANDTFLIPHLKELFKVCIDSFQMIQRKIDGRDVIEIKGHNIAISEILQNVENKLTSKTNVEEVRIVCNNVHIDANLGNTIWHGKNIAIYAKQIEVHDKIVWDVSGMDNDHVYYTNAGTMSDGNGKQGEDGFAGESGGNITILTSKLENSNNFTIVSNGGKGSNGQDGGDGKDGTDGRGITMEEFKDKFPPIIKAIFKRESKGSYDKTIASIKDEAGNVRSGSYKEHYVDTITKDGRQIIFSCNQDHFVYDNAYLIYKGSPGKPGGLGGQYGLSGKGGYAGELTIINPSENKEYDVTKIMIPGVTGRNGKSGLNGKYGNHGWDVGYVDHKWWKHTKFYGEGHTETLTLEYYNENKSNRVWCSEKHKYVAIETSAIQHHQVLQYQETNTMRENRSHQNHAQAVRKKNISSNSMLANYRLSEQYEGTSNIQQSITDLEAINLQAIQAFVSNQTQQQQQQKQCEMSVNRLTFYTENVSHWNDIRADFKGMYKDNNKSEFWVKRVSDVFNVPDYWFQLTSVELSHNQLEMLYEIYKNLKSVNINYNWIGRVKQILLDKYEKATLNEISKQIYVEVASKHQTKPEEAVRYLKEQTYFVEDIFHPQTKESLGDYLNRNQNRNRHHISKHCENLAFEFGINIKVYVMNQDYKLVLQNDHNPSCEKCIYILLRNNAIIRLSIDKKLAALERERNKKDEVYKKILTYVKTFKKKHEFDFYLTDKKYLTGECESDDKILCNEQQCIENITSYFNENEKTEISVRLQKLTFQFIGKNNILACLKQCFDTNGRHVSFQELCFLINSVLFSQCKDNKELNIFCWIISAYPQRNWIDELLIFQLENHFKSSTDTPKWRKYLSKIENVEILLWFSVKLDRNTEIVDKLIEDCLYLLSNTSGNIDNLGKLELTEWPDAIKENYWSQRLSVVFDWTQGDLSTTIQFVLAVENSVGSQLMEDLITALNDKRIPCSPVEFNNVMYNFYCEKWILNQKVIKNLKECQIWKIWVEEMNQQFGRNLEERNVNQLQELITTNSHTSQNIINNFPMISQRIKSIREAKNFVDQEYTKTMINIQIEKFLKQHYKSSKTNLSNDIENTLIAVIDRVIELKRGFKLRDTQKLAVLTLLTNNTSTLAQVSTGEGKSLIVVVASIVMALREEKVHIVTSSSVLAIRDAEINKDIYNLFGIDVGHNCSENIEMRKKAYSNNQVVYGDLSSFQQDYLLDKFYGNNILGDHDFKNVVIDEVDSMLLDKGNNMLYLSHNLAGLDKLDSVYIYIWDKINKLAEYESNFSLKFSTDAIRQSVMNDGFGIVSKDDIQKLDSQLNEHQLNMIWERLIQLNILDCNGKLLRSDIHANELKAILLHDKKYLHNRLDFLLNYRKEQQKSLHVPNYLVPFVEQHLDTWINSARSAFFMIPGQHYVVDLDKSRVRPERNPIITIIDTDTGTDQKNSQWDEALHQFLQLKHGCKISLQNLKAVFVSNVSYFKGYQNLYGLSGTLGSHKERGLLQKIYNVDFVVIPTAKPRQFVELKEILCYKYEDWINEICNSATEIAKRRSVLAICETVKVVDEIKQALGDAENVHTYTRDYEQFEIAQGTQKLGIGQIIIATNLAGRGTDIKLTDQLQMAGGLHVCLTYLPNNIRIEQQAYGRAGRGGNLGSGQLIIYNKNLQQGSINKQLVAGMKKQRDSEELQRLSEVKTFYEIQIANEEEYFEKFKKQYEDLKKVVIKPLICLDAMNNKKNIGEMLLQSILDKWAFWLDKNNGLLRNIRDAQCKRDLDHIFDTFINQMKLLKCDTIEELFAWVEDHPVHMVKLAMLLINNDKHEHGIKLFDKVIANEPRFSEAAHYYKAYVLTKQINNKQYKTESKQIKIHLREAYNLFQEHKNFHTTSIAIVDRIKRNHNTIVQIKAFEEQQKAKANIYQAFLESINNMLGHHVTSKCFIEKQFSEESAEMLCEDLLKHNVLRKPKVKKSIHYQNLKAISLAYSVPVEVLRKFFSKWKGEEMDETAFLRDLKNCIMLPSREIFWKSLVEQGILYAEIKYVIVNIDKLKKVDLSLFDNLSTKGSIEEKNEILETGQIFLYDEYVKHQNNEKIYTKTDFTILVGKDRYLTLKKRGVLVSNKAAQFKENQINFANFSVFDSVTHNDLLLFGIDADESDKILSELVERNILQQCTSRSSNALKLKIQTCEFEKIQLPSFPVYETTICGLLLQCFAYRVALEGIASQLSNGISPVRIPLMIKPHRSILQDLMQHGIIKPIIIADADIDTRVIYLYENYFSSKDFFLQTLDRNKIVTKDCLNELLAHLLDKCWITKTDSNQYFISKPDRRNPLDSTYKSIQKTIETTLNYRLELVKPDSIQLITTVLRKQKSILKVCNVLKVCELKSLIEVQEIDGEERNIFVLNGLDQILVRITENFWFQFVINCTCVVVLALNFAGAVLNMVTKDDVVFKWENIRDLTAALSRLRGNLRLRDYNSLGELVNITLNTFFLLLPIVRNSPQLGIIIDFVTGLGLNLSILTNIAKTMINGSKIVRSVVPTIASYTNEIIQKQNCKQFVDDWRYTRLRPMTALDLTDCNIDIQIKKCLKQLGKRMQSDLLIAAEQTFVEHMFYTKILRLFQVCKTKSAKTFLNGLPNEFFSCKSISTQLILSANIINRSVVDEIKEAIGRLNNIHPMKLIETINEEVEWSEQLDHTTIFQKMIGNILDKLMERLDTRIYHEESQTNVQQLISVTESECFAMQMMDEWKALLRENLENFIEQHIEHSILLKGTKYMLKYVAKYIQPPQIKSNETTPKQLCDELRLHYEGIRKNKHQITILSIDKHITEKYHEMMFKLLSTNKNRKVYAAVVRENIPIDSTCIAFLIPVVQKVLQNGGIKISGLTLILEEKNNRKQTFSTGEVNNENYIMRLPLKHNRFFIDQSGNETDIQSNCLFNTLAQSIPKFKDIFPNNFGENLAKFIEEDKSIQNFF